MGFEVHQTLKTVSFNIEVFNLHSRMFLLLMRLARFLRTIGPTT